MTVLVDLTIVATVVGREESGLCSNAITGASLKCPVVARSIQQLVVDPRGLQWLSERVTITVIGSFSSGSRGRSTPSGPVPGPYRTRAASVAT
ncbi:MULTISPECIES: hypothetical protein [unclassified Brevibacterium]|uniref:hypothetical protein n=1 Tax=unclassified Brevibacterium TaxID=2614124 RepID=UPI00114CD0D4|nr:MULTISPECIES: hypothetical protein [unclassified Brevibacterium]